jgi:hypothetical protein
LFINVWSNLEVITFAGSELRLKAVRRIHVERRAVSATANPAVAVTSGNAPYTEMVDSQCLFARLVLHQVRCGNEPSVADAGPQNHSPHYPKPDGLPAAVADIGSSLMLRSAKHVTVAEAASSDPLTTSIETLFSELARRRLRKLAIEEKP